MTTENTFAICLIIGYSTYFIYFVERTFYRKLKNLIFKFSLIIFIVGLILIAVDGFLWNAKLLLLLPLYNHGMITTFEKIYKEKFSKDIIDTSFWDSPGKHKGFQMENFLNAIFSLHMILTPLLIFWLADIFII